MTFADDKYPLLGQQICRKESDDELVLTVHCYISPHIHMPEFITQPNSTLAPVIAQGAIQSACTDNTRHVLVSHQDHDILFIVSFIGSLIHALMAYRGNVRNVMPG